MDRTLIKELWKMIRHHHCCHLVSNITFHPLTRYHSDHQLASSGMFDSCVCMASLASVLVQMVDKERSFDIWAIEPHWFLRLLIGREVTLHFLFWSTVFRIIGVLIVGCDLRIVAVRPP